MSRNSLFGFLKNPLISVKKVLDDLGFLDRGEENLDLMAL